MAGFNILPRSKETCHCRTNIGLGAMSQVGIERKDMLSILPVDDVREGRLCLSLRDAAHQSRMQKR